VQFLSLGTFRSIAFAIFLHGRKTADALTFPHLVYVKIARTQLLSLRLAARACLFLRKFACLNEGYERPGAFGGGYLRKEAAYRDTVILFGDSLYLL
jgi:hypothetical protein